MQAINYGEFSDLMEMTPSNWLDVNPFELDISDCKIHFSNDPNIEAAMAADFKAFMAEFPTTDAQPEDYPPTPPTPDPELSPIEREERQKIIIDLTGDSDVEGPIYHNDELPYIDFSQTRLANDDVSSDAETEEYSDDFQPHVLPKFISRHMETYGLPVRCNGVRWTGESVRLTMLSFQHDLVYAGPHAGKIIQKVFDGSIVWISAFYMCRRMLFPALRHIMHQINGEQAKAKFLVDFLQKIDIYLSNKLN